MPDRGQLPAQGERDPCDGCDGMCGDVCPVYEARRLSAERRTSECSHRTIAEWSALEAENERLRELYENVVSNRSRFGWTINHLLECEEALRMVEAESERLRAENEKLRAGVTDAMVRLVEAGSRVNKLRWAIHDAEMRLTPGMRAGTAEAKAMLRSALESDEEAGSNG